MTASRISATALAALLALAACTAPDDGAAGEPNADPTSHDYRPGLAAFPHLPDGVTSAPVVVLVPGGSWESADPSGLEPLASALAEQGVVAVPVVIRAAEDGVVYPTPVEDILCALADAAATAEAEGITPERLVLLGHSSGAHLSAVTTLDAGRLTPSCEDPVVAPDALIGLAGPYDIRQFSDAAAALFEDGSDPGEWDSANPVLLAGQRPEVPALLLHGEADDVVPPSFSTQFGRALSEAGHPTTVQLLSDEDHDSIYSAETAAAPVVQWLSSLP